ncbi:alanine--tRNA ligase [Eremococcus coleocola]|uniref:Alanine--tRNA ligase n=1 Tax=Eremococcus coleocola ACS-139-V-Col8 TaxID=908337 RepID=E4KP16_9LACT|nr:alanine--tRNA ligase [Eremococcus coleocola]EFR31153.1 alanine--tRNA ligase [Eremococcus coleocola ACS-139-V-Col8]
MKELTSAQIRQMYLDFFAEKNHDVKPSASLIPINDPTLLWINSGVATLKKYFDGTEVPANPRITNAQKCIRTNDIENVGVTARHHTLFEMLGNWSIGDYFKEEAIAWAWEFLTSDKWMGFEPELLYATYYPEDTDTPEIWKQQPNFNPDHLVPVEDNFWDIGAGPCGPDTEIFYDRGEAYNNLAEDDPENYPGGENERWLEIWNLVFSEFNHMPDDTYQPLPNKNVDTGMGLERMTSVVQDTPTNFETDLFLPIIKQIEGLTDGIVYEEAGANKVSFKVIADHIRAVSFAISDGALPSNEGRGYILRRLIRRSVMHGRRLGIKDKFLAQLVPTIAQIMGQFYSELQEKVEFVQSVLASEEDRFHETIEAGEDHLVSIIESLKTEEVYEIPGDQAFKLYDTFGFPLELTQEEAELRGFSVDTQGFEAEMEQQRQRARQARSKEESMNVQSTVFTDIHTEYDFVGYDSLVSNATVKAIVFEDESVQNLAKNQIGWVFFNRSPFYAEMGGQIADKGLIMDGNDEVGRVLDVQKAPNGQAMHKVEALTMPINLDQSYTLQVDPKHRTLTNQNHTATHLLHRALKDVLGDHANQAGSYVGPDRLRFDFSHFGKMTAEEIKAVEDKVNAFIEASLAVNTTEMPIDEAKALGAMALFGEKYGDVVRVVNISNESIELCGGTHVANTNQIGTFKLLSETGIGAGIRRIEALTGQAAFNYYRDQEAILHQIQDRLKVSQTDMLVNRIDQMQAELKEAHAQIESLQAKVMQAASDKLFDEVKEVGAVSYIALSLKDQSADAMRQLGDIWKQKANADLLIVAADNGEKANLLVLANDQAIDKGVKAGDLIKALAKYVQGGGGGKPQMAQAGGKNPVGIPELMESIDLEIEKLVK